MSTLQEKQAIAREAMAKQNPSNPPGATREEMKRIPLSVPLPKLAVPEIPGYHTHWFRGEQQRIQQALAAGYTWVHPSEVNLNAVSLGGDATKSGNTDMGDRVSIVEGALVDGAGQAVRMYLMKQPLEYYLEDQKILHARNDSVAEALSTSFKRGTVGGPAQGETQVDMSHRYVDKARTKVPDLFRKKGKG